MADIFEWSVTAANNTADWPEGMNRSDVNDKARSMEATLRTFYNDPNWIRYGDGELTATVAYATATSFTVAGADVTAVYHAGRRVKASGSSTGTIYGTITSSSFSTNTTVNVEWDDYGALANESLTIWISSIARSGSQVPAFAQQLPNLLPNGDCLIWQRGTSFTSATSPANNDDTYLMDGCILLSDGNDIVDVTRDVNISASAFVWPAITLDTETANKKFGILFPLENHIARAVIAQQCSLSFKAKKNSGNTTLETIRVGILSWTGTADSITSDVVSAWAVAGTNPTLATSWAYANTPTNIVLTSTVTEYRINNISIGSTSNNVAVFIWVDDTDATVGDTISITDVNLVFGRVAVPIMRRQFGEALRACQRYFAKTFEYDTAPAQNAGVTAALQSFGSSAGSTILAWQLPVEMRVAPTVTTYNPSAAASSIRNVPDSTNTAVAATDTASSRVVVRAGPNASDADDRMLVHAAATAEL